MNLHTKRNAEGHLDSTWIKVSLYHRRFGSIHRRLMILLQAY